MSPTPPPAFTLPPMLALPDTAPGLPLPQVRQEGHRLTLRFDTFSIQSAMCLDEPNRLVLEYTRAMMLFLLFNPAPQRVLMIGLGGGSLPKYGYHHLPDTDITVVEINPAVIALRETFAVPPDGPRFRVLCGDGAEHVRAVRHSEDDSPRYDVVLVDGFDPGGQPEALCTQDFYDACRAALHPDGVLVVNLDSDPVATEPLLARIEHAFDSPPHTVLTEGGTNRIALAASAVQQQRAHAQVRRRWQALPAVHRQTLRRSPSDAQAPGWPTLG